MTDREQLARQIEAADGPSRELDKVIARAIGLFDGTRSSYDLQHNLIPTYTASIDAAMMLVPEGWRPYTLDMSVKGRSRWMLEGPKTKWVKDEEGGGAAGDDWFAQGIAATPALALSAAAVRAGGE